MLLPGPLALYSFSVLFSFLFLFIYFGQGLAMYPCCLKLSLLQFPHTGITGIGYHTVWAFHIGMGSFVLGNSIPSVSQKYCLRHKSVMYLMWYYGNFNLVITRYKSRKCKYYQSCQAILKGKVLERSDRTEHWRSASDLKCSFLSACSSFPLGLSWFFTLLKA